MKLVTNDFAQVIEDKETKKERIVRFYNKHEKQILVVRVLRNVVGVALVGAVIGVQAERRRITRQ